MPLMASVGDEPTYRGWTEQSHIRPSALCTGPFQSGPRVTGRLLLVTRGVSHKDPGTDFWTRFSALKY